MGRQMILTLQQHGKPISEAKEILTNWINEHGHVLV